MDCGHISFIRRNAASGSVGSPSIVLLAFRLLLLVIPVSGMSGWSVKGNNINPWDTIWYRVGRERAAIGPRHRGKSSLHPEMRVGKPTGRDPELWNRNDTAAGMGVMGKDPWATGEPPRTTPADSMERRTFAGASRNEAYECRTRPGYGAKLNAANRPGATSGGEQKEAYSSHPAQRQYYRFI